MIWFRKHRHGASSEQLTELDQRVKSAQIDRQEAAEIRRVSESKGNRLRHLIEKNGFGQGFVDAFEAARKGRHP